MITASSDEAVIKLGEDLGLGAFEVGSAEANGSAGLLRLLLRMIAG